MATSADLRSVTLGFIGAGAMASALSGGLISARTLSPSSITLSDIDQKQLQSLNSSLSVNITSDNTVIAKQCSVIVLAVKPHFVVPVLRQISSTLSQRQSPPLIVSIAAGISIRTMASVLPPSTPLIRVVPNTPALVGVGVSVLSCNNCVSESQLAVCQALLSSVGTVLSLPESLLDAVTGLSGSGPAFIFTVIEALSDGGVRAGLPRHVSTELAARTMYGAAKMALESGKHTGQLKDSVASPNGTTIRGLHELERGGLRGTLMSAVLAATERGKEMGDQYEAALMKELEQSTSISKLSKL